MAVLLREGDRADVALCPGLTGRELFEGLQILFTQGRKILK